MFVLDNKVFMIEDIEALEINSKTFVVLKSKVKKNELEFRFPNDVETTSHKRIYKTGFVKNALNHLFTDLKKSEIHDLVCNNYDIMITTRNIYRNVKKFDNLFRS